MRRYIMEWDPEKRQVPLQKIMDIFHELGQEEVKCYVLIKPQHKNVIEELKSREDLTFYWEEDLGLRGSIFYSHELMPAWIRVFSIDKLDSIEEFDEILFWDDYYPVGTVVLSKNIMLPYNEAYSAAGKTWFGWWLVEHYFSYHVDCPDGCDSGEPARGRKDPPYFQMSYGSFDNIADLVDSFVESFLTA